MKLSRREVELLDFLLQGSATTTTLSTALAIKKPNLSKYLKKLKYYNLVQIKREGPSGIVSLSPLISSNFSSAKLGFPFLKLIDIFVGWTPSLLSYMKYKKKFILSDLDLPTITSKRILKKLRSIGLVHMAKKGQYELRDEAIPIAEFCSTYLTMIYGSSASREIKGLTTWVSSIDSIAHMEVIFISKQKVTSKKYWPTAFSAFDRYGIHLISAGNFYYTNIKPNLRDIVIHTLALSNDARNISYVSALIIKNSFNPKKLLKKRRMFGLERDFINNLIEFIETKDQKTFPGFPSWEEVQGVLND